MASVIDSPVLGSMLDGQTAYFNGPSLGIGLKLLLTDNVYVFAEYGITTLIDPRTLVYAYLFWGPGVVPV